MEDLILKLSDATKEYAEKLGSILEQHKKKEPDIWAIYYTFYEGSTLHDGTMISAMFDKKEPPASLIIYKAIGVGPKNVLLKPAHSSEVRPQNFTKEDWYGYAGAVRNAEDIPPQIWRFDHCDVLISGSGAVDGIGSYVEVEVFDDNEEGTSKTFASPDMPYSCARHIGQHIAVAILAGADPEVVCETLGLDLV